MFGIYKPLDRVKVSLPIKDSFLHHSGVLGRVLLSRIAAVGVDRVKAEVERLNYP
jgi:hypothetical protein